MINGVYVRVYQVLELVNRKIAFGPVSLIN